MTNTFKIGDKFLLPVTFKGYMGPKNKPSTSAWLNLNGRDLHASPPDVDALIPASTLTDLQAENVKLKMALVHIKDLLEQPNHRDVTPEVVYQTALKALGGSE